MRKSFFDLKNIANSYAAALIYDGKPAGRILASFSDNPNGSVCTAFIMITEGPLKDMQRATGKAGGYGYDKLSAAVEDALRKAEFELWDTEAPSGYPENPKGRYINHKRLNGQTAWELCPVEGGTGEIAKHFEALGYTYFVING